MGSKGFVSFAQFIVSIGLVLSTFYSIYTNDIYNTLTSNKKKDVYRSKAYDILIVGCGLSGTVLADLLARRENKRVLIIDKRDHIGGNCYDYIDNETGILCNKYGGHIFHTGEDIVWKYVTRFSEWELYEHRVVGFVDDKYIPIPVSIETVNTLLTENIANRNEMDKWLNKHQLKLPNNGSNPKNGEEIAKMRVGEFMFKKIFEQYTYKQWNKYPYELDPSVLARIPYRNNFDDRYFPNDPYQFLPKYGYTKWFENALDDDNIKVLLNSDYFTLRKNDNFAGQTLSSFEQIFYTGPIDFYFAEIGYDKLEYRSLIFEVETFKNTPFYQINGAISYPQFKYGNFTRIREYKHFYKSLHQHGLPHTIVFKEYSSDVGEPYYPVPSPRNKNLYLKYQKLANKEQDKHNIYFVGRLANYKYFNMDKAILNALQLYEKLYSNNLIQMEYEFENNNINYEKHSLTQCNFQISFVFNMDSYPSPSTQISREIKQICGDIYYTNPKQKENIIWYFYGNKSYDYFVGELTKHGCHLEKNNNNNINNYFDNLFVIDTSSYNNEGAGQAWIHHMIMTQLYDVNIFLNNHKKDFDFIKRNIEQIKQTLYVNKTICGTRATSRMNRLVNMDKHFNAFTYANGKDIKNHKAFNEYCNLLNIIWKTDQFTDEICLNFKTSNTNQFIATEAAIRRMLQKHRTILSHLYKSKTYKFTHYYLHKIWSVLFSNKQRKQQIIAQNRNVSSAKQILASLVSSNETGKLNSLIASKMFPKYYYYDNIYAFKYFEHCTIMHWGKQSAQHFFIQQLIENKYNKRVYSCDEADIFVIPVDFGNGKRGGCIGRDENYVKNEINKITQYIFENKHSCWNNNTVEKRNAHFVIAGNYHGLQMIPTQWTDSADFIIGDRKLDRNKVYTSICIGLTPILSAFSYTANDWRYKYKIENRKFANNIKIKTEYKNIVNQNLPNQIITNEIKWVNRQYKLFFMGQIGNVFKTNNWVYRGRRDAMTHLQSVHNKNVLIETGVDINQFMYPLCNQSLLSFPCATIDDTKLFVKLLSNSQFNLMMRGDNWCSQRFYDAISLDVINIVISDGFADCLFGYEAYTIPYHQMFLWIKESDFAANPLQSIMDIIQKYDDRYFENMLKLIHKYKKYLLWDRIDSDAAHFALHQGLIKYKHHNNIQKSM